MIIDFEKATRLSEGKHYRLSELEKRDYIIRYPHIAPEPIEGESKQSTCTDIFSFGKFLFHIIDCCCITDLSRDHQCKFKAFAEKLLSVRYCLSFL